MHASFLTPNQLPRPSSSPRNDQSGQHRPATIAELAERARDDLWDPSKALKFWLRTAEKRRRAGKTYEEAGDLESAFVEYAKAATIVLEKLPSHRDYHGMLNAEQRHNLGLVSVMQNNTPQLSNCLGFERDITSALLGLWGPKITAIGVTSLIVHVYLPTQFTDNRFLAERSGYSGQPQ